MLNALNSSESVAISAIISVAGFAITLVTVVTIVVWRWARLDTKQAELSKDVEEIKSEQKRIHTTLIDKLDRLSEHVYSNIGTGTVRRGRQ